MNAEARHRAKRSLGQNFLVDANLQRKIVEGLEPTQEDEVLEVGPGRGALTTHLAGQVGHLVLVELDDELARELRDTYATRREVEVIHGDVLEVDWGEHIRNPMGLKVIGNIPYNITSPILFRLLRRPRPRSIVLMIQGEVADRLVAPVGTKSYGALSVGVRTVASVERLFRVSRKAFRPVPGVDSAVVRIRPFDPPRMTEPEEVRLRHLVRSAFQWRRKQLGKILRDHPDLGYPRRVCEEVATEVGIELENRPERLSPEEFVALAAALP